MELLRGGQQLCHTFIRCNWMSTEVVITNARQKAEARLSLFIISVGVLIITRASNIIREEGGCWINKAWQVLKKGPHLQARCGNEEAVNERILWHPHHLKDWQSRNKHKELFVPILLVRLELRHINCYHGLTASSQGLGMEVSRWLCGSKNAS